MLSIESTGSLFTTEKRDRMILGVIAAVLSTLAGAIPLRAAEVSGEVLPPIRTIQVEGDGEARAKPDKAVMNVAIETQAATAEQSARANATLADNVAAALKLKLAGKGKIETGGYSLSPVYNQPSPNQKPRITGYRAVNSITVETGDTALIGQLIDAAIRTGANRINSLNFTLSDDAKARREAIGAASRHAQAQAEALAASLGVRLKRIYSATTSAEFAQSDAMGAGAAGAFGTFGVTTPVEPSEVTIPAHVSLTYEIE